MLIVDNERISAAEFFAQMVEGKSKSTATSVSKLISMRIPVDQLAQIDTFAEMTNSNRNKAIVNLLGVAIEEVLNKIEDHGVKEKFKKLEYKKLEVFMSETGKTTEIYNSESPLVVQGKTKKKPVK